MLQKVEEEMKEEVPSVKRILVGGHASPGSNLGPTEMREGPLAYSSQSGNSSSAALKAAAAAAVSFSTS